MAQAVWIIKDGNWHFTTGCIASAAKKAASRGRTSSSGLHRAKVSTRTPPDVFGCKTARTSANAIGRRKLPKDRASASLREHVHAETELIGKAVVLTDGKAGTGDGLFLDEYHGLRVSVAGYWLPGQS